MRKRLRTAFLCAAPATGFLPSPRAKGAGFSNASLSGRCNFRFYGRDFADFPAAVRNAAIAAIAAVSAFVADGKGAIAGGGLFSDNDGGERCPDRIVNGAYEILGDGEGSLDLKTSPQTATCPLAGDFRFDVALGRIGPRSGSRSGPRSGILPLAQIAGSSFSLASGVTTSQVALCGVAERD